MDTATARDVRLDRELVRAGHADSRPDSALAVSVAASADEASDASDAGSDEVDSLLAVVLHFDGRSEDSASASASQTGGAPAPRLAPWGCGADDDDAASAAPPAGSLRLARLRALHAGAASSPPPPPPPPRTGPAARSLLLRRRLAIAKAT